MKKRNNIIPFLLIALTLVILITNTVNMTMALSPADLSSTPTKTYTIEFSILFGTDEDSEQFHHQNSYLANEFHCYLTDTNEYLLAEYDETEKCYVLTGYTENKDEATVFIGGKDIDNTKMVIISGLPANNYTIVHTKSTEGYTLIKEPIDICIMPDGATVTDAVVGITTDNRVIFRIMLTPGYDLPNCCGPNSNTYLVITSISAFVLIGCVLAMVIMYVNYKRRKAARAEAKRKAMNEETAEMISQVTDFNGDTTTMEPTDAIIENIGEMPEFTGETVNHNTNTPVDIEINDDTSIPDTAQVEPADNSENIPAVESSDPDVETLDSEPDTEQTVDEPTDPEYNDSDTIET